jgi:hypothetical protein
MRLLATTAVAGVAVTLQMTGPGASASSTRVVAVSLAGLPVPVHGSSGLFLRDEVPEPRPTLAAVHRSVVQLHRTSEEQPGVEP